MNVRKLRLVGPGEPPRGPERKRRRLAAAIPSPEPGRPRVPLQADTGAVLDSAAWRERWGGIRPVAETVSIYVAGCIGTMALGALLGMPVLKTGTAQDVGARIAKLNGGRYGSLAIRDFAIHDEPGWDDWAASKLSARPTHPASPVRVLPRELRVDLPFWVTPADFEALFTAALEPSTLAHLAARSEGRALGRRRGCDPDALLRYTRSARGPVLATEIGVIAPSGDAARLVTLCEWIVIRLVLADAGER